MINVLVLNAGSSSLKYQLIDMENETVLNKGLCERIGYKDSVLVHTDKAGNKTDFMQPMETHREAIALVIEKLTDPKIGAISSLKDISAVGHRVVHGAEYFNTSVAITDEVIQRIDEASALAPLHNPANLMGIRACKELLKDVPMAAVFDTAFHQSMPRKAYLYALPYNLYEKDKVRRYGFHGTSHMYIAGRVAKVLGEPIEKLKIITCHLGNGASVCAIDHGKSVDTSMGFTPLEGLMMGTRCGDIDAAVCAHIMNIRGMSVSDVLNMMNKKSGLLGVSGVSNDFRDVYEAAQSGNQQAATALEMYAYRVKKYIGSYAAAMNGVDVIVFSGGIGENACAMREMILTDMEFMGVEFDAEANEIRGKEQRITTPESRVAAYIIPTNEELVIARDTKAVFHLA